jgi:hypothetical protein
MMRSMHLTAHSRSRPDGGAGCGITRTTSLLVQVETTSYALVDNKAVAASSRLHLQNAAARKTYYNLPMEQLHAPILGGCCAGHGQQPCLRPLRQLEGAAKETCRYDLLRYPQGQRIPTQRMA